MRGRLVAVLLLLSSSCLPDAEFECNDNRDCSGGLCANVGYCIFSDNSCVTGFRFSEHAGEVGGQDLSSACGTPFGVFSTATGRWYATSDDDQDWRGAQEVCVAMADGGHLADIESQAENDYVLALTDSDPHWLGGVAPDQPNTWTWITGAWFAFASWEPGRPADDGCLTFDGSTGMWRSDSCDNGHHYVCEWP